VPAYGGENPTQSIEVLSKPYTIDRIYKSMEGPGGIETFKFGKNDKPELMWITGGRVEVFNAKNFGKKTSVKVCHANLRFDPREFSALNPNSQFNHMTHQSLKLFSFIEGQPEILFPDGFGITILSSRLFEFNFGTMNPIEPQEPFDIKAKASFYYKPDTKLDDQLNPLFMRILVLRVPADNKGSHKGSNTDHHPAKGSAQPAEISLHTMNTNESGYEQAYHWIVPPGRHTYKYKIEKRVMAEFPFDTTIHYINAHLHHHAESIELRNITTGETLFKGSPKTAVNGLFIEAFNFYSDQQGIPFYQDHEYELISIYNNTTGESIDAMALLFVYLLDKNFDRKQLKLLTSI